VLIGSNITKKLILISMKKFPEREELMKKCAKVEKSYRTGNFVKKSINTHNVNQKKVC